MSFWVQKIASEHANISLVWIFVIIFVTQSRAQIIARKTIPVLHFTAVVIRPKRRLNSHSSEARNAASLVTANQQMLVIRISAEDVQC